MADAIAAKGMFYINASVTNTHGQDRLAEIVIRDNSDILFRDQGWMVHITRFSCSTQQSLHFIDKDDELFITFRYENQNFGNAIRQFTWRATEDVNTLAAFLKQVNDSIPVMDHQNGAVPTAVFTVTQDGRFRLATHNSIGLGPEQYLGIAPSPKFADIVGWDEAELNIAFQASSDLKCRQYIRWYESIFPGTFRGKYLEDGNEDDWTIMHNDMMQYFMWDFCNVQGINVNGTLHTNVGNLAGCGPNGLRRNGAQAGPYLDDWLHPRTAVRQITTFYNMDPVLVTNGGHGRVVGMYRRAGLTVGGTYTLRDSRTGVINTVPVAGTANRERYVVDSNIVMGQICEMRMIAMNSSNRVLRVGRAPDQTAGGGTNQFGRFARLGDSVFISYSQPAQAILHYDESHMLEFKIIRIDEVAPGNYTTWGPPGNVANHYAFDGRQQDLYLDCALPQENHGRMIQNFNVINAGNAGGVNFFGEKILIGTRRMPGDTMIDTQVIQTVAATGAAGEYLLGFVALGWTWLLGDVVVSPTGERGVVTGIIITSSFATVTWPSYVPVQGQTLTHYHKDAFDAVFAEDMRNLRQMSTLTKCLPYDRQGNPQVNGNKIRYIQWFCEHDPLLHDIISRPNILNFHVQKEIKESFFAHQANVQLGHVGGPALLLFFSTDAVTVAAPDYAILPHCTCEDGYWPSGMFSIICEGGKYDTYFQWLSDKLDADTLLSDSGPRLRFSASAAGSRRVDRHQNDANAYWPTVLDVIPGSRSVDGNNRILLAYTDLAQNFTQAQFLGNGTNLNGLHFRTDVANALMLRSIINKKATTSSVITAEANGGYIRLETKTNDAIQSQLSGQVDLAMPWRAINIVSPDLLHEPERSQDANSELPILSSYTLQAQFDPSVDDQGDITGFTSTPHGDMQFSEGGLRRYHRLVKVPGGLRTFSLQAQLSPKDPSKPIKRILLPPGGSFNCQILFLQKH